MSAALLSVSLTCCVHFIKHVEARSTSHPARFVQRAEQVAEDKAEWDLAHGEERQLRQDLG